MSVPRPQVWAGVEPSHLTIRGERRDQLARTGHADRVDDIDLLAELGVRAVRYPILWGRGGPETDWDWAQERLDRLDGVGIEPVVGLLHHGWGPDGIDPLDPGYAASFVEYAVAVAQRFPGIRTFLPINEPLTTARFGGLYGWWDPGGRDEDTFARLLVGEALAIRDASRALRRMEPGVRIVANEDVGVTHGTPELRDVVAHYNERRWLTYDLLTGRVDVAHPWFERLARTPFLRRTLDSLAADPEYPDVLGIDHYLNSDRFLDHRVERYPREMAALASASFADVELARVSGFEIDGFWESLRSTWDRYRLPMVLAEVHLGGEPRDEAAWWTEAWHQARAAIEAGMTVEAVTAWAAFGSSDWDSLLRIDAGSYKAGVFDAQADGGPARTALGDLVAATASGQDPDPRTRGWWRSADRALAGVEPSAA